MTGRPLFITGAVRSGTTLVHALLGSHRSIELQNETELIASLIRVGVGPADAVPPDQRFETLVSLIRDGASRAHIAALPPARIIELLSAPDDLRLGQIYERLLPRPRSDIVWGEKSFGYAYLVREIASVYPTALFVHVLRDPRATTRSYADLRQLADEPSPLTIDAEAVGSVAYHAARWASWTDAVDAAAADLPDGSLTRLRYERLVEDPAEVLRGVCSLLAVEFDEGMLDAERRRMDPALRGHALGRRRSSAPIDRARESAGEALAPWAVGVVERYAGAAMERHGYQLRNVEINPEEQDKVERELAVIDPILRERIEQDPVRFPRRALLRAIAERREVATEASPDEIERLRALAVTATRRQEEFREIRQRFASQRAKLDALREQLAESERRREESETVAFQLRQRVKELEYRIDGQDDRIDVG